MNLFVLQWDKDGREMRGVVFIGSAERCDRFVELQRMASLGLPDDRIFEIVQRGEAQAMCPENFEEDEE